MDRDPHIVLMGFKHVGKSIIGKALASQLGLPFYELDVATEQLYTQRTGEIATCRDILQAHGEDYFRALESETLMDVLKRPRGVVALGGGTPMIDCNRSLIRGHIPVHITAPQDIVQKRVVAAGWPLAQRFDEIWQVRDPVYRQLAQITIENTSSIEDGVNQIVAILNTAKTLI